jgi:hypothetical protein
MSIRTATFASVIILIAVLAVGAAALGQRLFQPAALLAASPLAWTRLSSEYGDLAAPQPGSTATEQTATLILDINGDNLNDFVVATRKTAPSIVWYERTATGWTQRIIEGDALRIEAGGTFHDIDGDGDPDIVFGCDGSCPHVWWWENPAPDFSREWTRRLVKTGGLNDTTQRRHHDMVFGNFDGDAAAELAFWNQNARALLLADIPPNPRTTEPWPDIRIIGDMPLGVTPEYEGLVAADMNGDGREDLVGGGRWFEQEAGGSFTARWIDNQRLTRMAVGQIVPGGWPEVVQSPGEFEGTLKWYETTDGLNWQTHELMTVDNAHSLEIADLDEDGHRDIFLAEMGFTPGNPDYNPAPRMMILFGNGQGGFETTVMATGYGNHEARVADLDGDGDLDILGKPYTQNTPRVDVWLNRLRGDHERCASRLDNWRTTVIDPARPNRAVFVDAADLDGDSFADLVSGAWWYRNPGVIGGTWERQAIGAGLDQMAVLGDFDGDLDIDILGTTNNDPDKPEMGNAFVWAQNDGGGTFTVYTNLPAGDGNFLQGAVAAQFTPGVTEIALSWHRNGTLQSLTVPADPVNEAWAIRTLSTVTQEEALSAADIDRDGDTDLLLGTTWLRNDLDEGGDWTPATLHTTSDLPDRNRLADIDGDGRLDAVIGYETASSSSRKLAWYRQPAGQPASAWSEAVIDLPIAPMSVDVADLDGDGDEDVVAGEHNLASPQNARFLVYENLDGAGGGWKRHVGGQGYEHHNGAQLADLDNDGDIDAYSIGWNHNNVLAYEQRGCAFDPAIAATPAGSPNATSVPGQTPTATATGLPPTGPGDILYVSSTSGGAAGGVTFTDEDILRYDTGSRRWSVFFDGSAFGLGGTDLDAFTLLPDGSILFSLDAPFTVPGPGKVDDSDVIRFSPVTGSFSWYVDGSDLGLTTNGEDIDGIGIGSDGRLLLSTLGTANVSGLTAADEDLLELRLTNPGATTAGTWTLAFDGSDVALSATSEDTTGIWRDPATGALYLAQAGAFTVPGASGNKDDVVRCLPGSLGPATSCTWGPGLFWNGGSHGFGAEKLDGIVIALGAGGTPVATATPTPSHTPTPTPPPTATPTPPTTPTAVSCAPPRPLDRWTRHEIDSNRDGQATFMFTFDIDDDNHLDIVTGKYWYRNPGTAGGTWARTAIGAPLTDTIAAEDFDGDGDTDLLGTAGSVEIDQGVWAPFVWARNNGNATFSVFGNIDSPTVMPVNDPVQGVAIGRFTSGGPLEIAVTWDDTERTGTAANPNGIQMLTVPADPETETWPRRTLSTVSLGEEITADDIDGDGDLDLMLGQKWLRNDQDQAGGGWTLVSAFPWDDGQISRNRLNDLDGDGDLDVVIGPSHTTALTRVAWYEQRAGLNWLEHLILTVESSSPPRNAESMDTADMDGDGDMDVIVGEYRIRFVDAEEYPAKLHIAENLGDGESWRLFVVHDGDSHYQSSQAVDIDGDGDLDIISKGWVHSRVHIYENGAADHCIP